MATQDCIDRVQAAVQSKLARALTDDEMITVFRRVDRFIERGEARGQDTPTIEAELIKFAEDTVVATIIQKNNAARDALHVARIVESLTTTFAERPDVGVEAILMGIQRDVYSSRYFLGDHITTKQDAVLQIFTTELEAAGLRLAFRNATKVGLDTDIFRAMDQLHSAEPKFDGIAPEAVTIAKIIDKHSDMLRVEGNRFGAHIGRQLGFVTQRVHDTLHLNKDPDGWLNYMTEHLDIEKSFPTLNAKENLNDILRSEYAQLVSGRHLHFTDSLKVSGFKGFSNTARQLSHDRVFHFKTPEAEAGYLRKFGPGDLATAVMNGMSRHARDVAIIQHFGPAAKANLDRAIDLVMKKKEYRGNAELSINMKAMQAKVNDVYWPTLSGLAAIPGPSKAAKMATVVDHTVRSVNRLSLLPALLLSQIPDIAFFGSAMSRQGRGFLTGALEAVDGVLRGLPEDVKREVVSVSGVAIDGAIASVSGRLDVNTHIPGKLSSIEQLMYRYTGSQPWTDRMRAKFVATDSHFLALNAEKNFDQLNPDLQRVLRQQGILPQEWALFKGLRETMSDGKSYIVAERAMELDDALFIKELQRIGLKPTKRRIEEFRLNFRDKVRGFFHDLGDEAVLSPDMKTRALVTKGQQQGTWPRVLLNQFFALKTFPILVAQRVLGAETLGRSSDLNATGLTSLKIFGTDGSAFRGVAQMILLSTALGYVSITLKDFVKGRKPRDPLSAKTWVASMLAGGGGAIYGDFLFGDMKSRYGNNIITTAAGPGAQDFANVGDIWGKWMEGDAAADELFRLAMNNLPFAGTGPLRTALDYIILNEIAENLSPGYLRRTEQRLKRNVDQEFFFPPSQQ